MGTACPGVCRFVDRPCARGRPGSTWGPTHDRAQARVGRRITVNAVAPGYVEDTGFFGDALSGTQRAAKLAEAMNGRAGTPDDVANTIGWLAAPASCHVTAQIVQVNGGAERGR
ncbi:SDR family oxidoreductase [Bordetella genomosp. 9]|uniref:SDR family oxidoreductase n=1 Tax=Bordetella genomosp. 9 TaxID=1416803 RepID=UPI00211ADAD2|nr:SDR family oxidoreductase [Bordetella genomosp. 9]